MNIYVNICLPCALSMGGREPHNNHKKMREDARCDCCEKHANVYDAHRVGIMYSGKIMDGVSYKIMNGLLEKKEVEINKPIELVFGKK